MPHIDGESEESRLGPKLKREVSMRRILLTIIASLALVAVGSFASSAHETGASGHHKRISHHANVAHPKSGDITSFSSSSVLHVGVNHPPKNR
jgi:hypothetical protein